MERQKEIINAALELASERGLGAVSMQQIADRVGITKAQDTDYTGCLSGTSHKLMHSFFPLWAC